jgi:hypothetical protein
VNDGILGSFSFHRNGDITVDRIGVYRIASNGKSLLLDQTIELHYGFDAR